MNLIILLIISSAIWPIEAKPQQRYPMVIIKAIRNINIGGLFSVYQNAWDSNDVRCTNVYDEYSLLKVFSMIYVIDDWNQNHFIPKYNVSIGYYIVPTCEQPSTALLQTIIMVRLRHIFNIVGVIGPSSTLETSAVSPLLSFYHIPHISPEANGAQLSRKRYNYLFRITSQQESYIRAVINLYKHFRWNMISIIYSNDFHYAAYQERLSKALLANNICVKERIALTNRNLNMTQYMPQLVSMLRNNTRAKIIMLMLNYRQYIPLLEALQSIPNHVNHTFIGLDSWPTTAELDRHRLQDVLVGSLIILEYANITENLGSWLKMKELTSEKLLKDRRLNHDTQEKQQFTQSNLPLYNHPWFLNLIKSNQVKHIERLKIDRRVALTLDSVKSMLVALDISISTNCKPYLDILKKSSPEIYTKNHKIMIDCILNQNLKSSFLQINFTGQSGHIQFNKDQSVDESLRLANFQKLSEGYNLQTVGTFDTTVRPTKLTLNNPIQWNTAVDNATGAPMSSCSLPCKSYQRPMTTDRKCCWACRSCQNKRMIFTPISMLAQNNFQTCMMCPALTAPKRNRSRCFDLPVIRVADHQVWPFIYFLAAFGIFLSCIALLFYLIYYMATTFRLEYRILLHSHYVGIFLGFASIMMVLVKWPKYPVCAASLFFFTMSVTFIFVSLLARQYVVLKKYRSNVTQTKEELIKRNIWNLLGISLMAQIVLFGIYVGLGESVIQFNEQGAEKFAYFSSRPKHDFEYDETVSLFETLKANKYCSPFFVRGDFLGIQLTLQLICLVIFTLQTINLSSFRYGIHMEIMYLQWVTNLSCFLYLAGTIFYFILTGIPSLITWAMFYLIVLYINLYYVSVPKAKFIMNGQKSPLPRTPSNFNVPNNEAF